MIPIIKLFFQATSKCYETTSTMFYLFTFKSSSCYQQKSYKVSPKFNIDIQKNIFAYGTLIIHK